MAPMPAAPSAPATTVVELLPEEWPLVAHIEPFASGGLPAPNGYWRILAALQGPRLLGTVSIHTQVHFDPWWIAPDARGNPAVVGGLVRKALGIFRKQSVGYVFCTIADDQPEVQHAAEHLGFERAPGALYLLDLDRLARLAPVVS